MVRLDLLQKSLILRKDWSQFRVITLHKSYITWLFKNYTTIEYCIDYYDDEPDVPEKWQLRTDIDIWTDNNFLTEWRKLCADYEERRLNLCNWQEPVFEGNWDVTQKEVDEIAHTAMLECRNRPISKKNRFWVGHIDADTIICYWYGRDLKGTWTSESYNDRCWIMKRKKVDR